jgi:hypothetical protein
MQKSNSLKYLIPLSTSSLGRLEFDRSCEVHSLGRLEHLIGVSSKYVSPFYKEYLLPPFALLGNKSTRFVSATTRGSTEEKPHLRDRREDNNWHFKQGRAKWGPDIAIANSPLDIWRSWHQP